MDINNSTTEPSSNNGKKYFCDVCNVEFSSRSGHWKHNQKLHPEKAASNTRIPKMKCGLCDQLFLSQVDICNHLTSVHTLPMTVQDKEFRSLADFDAWKKEEEEKGRFQFVKRHSNAASGYACYYCHRSGTFKTKGKQDRRAPRHDTSKLCNFQCSAFITLRITDSGTIYIQYCLSHYGHDHELKRLRVSQAVRDDIANQLMDERDTSFILRNIGGM